VSHEAAHRSCIISRVVLTTNLERSVPASAYQSPGLLNLPPANLDNACETWTLLTADIKGWKPSTWNANAK